MSLGLVLVACAEVVSAACAIHLWRRRAPTATKLGWTLVLAVPVLGPLLYGGLFEAPSVQAESDRASETTAARFYEGPGGGGTP